MKYSRIIVVLFLLCLCPSILNAQNTSPTLPCGIKFCPDSDRENAPACYINKADGSSECKKISDLASDLNRTFFINGLNEYCLREAQSNQGETFEQCINSVCAKFINDFPDDYTDCLRSSWAITMWDSPHRDEYPCVLKPSQYVS